MATSSPPRHIVGVSLKMYFDLFNSIKYVQGVYQFDGLTWNERVDFFVVLDFITILEAVRILEYSYIILGAQDTFWKDDGPYTGEVSPRVLQQAGVKIVEIGHAERRAVFVETDGRRLEPQQGMVSSRLSALASEHTTTLPQQQLE